MEKFIHRIAFALIACAAVALNACTEGGLEPELGTLTSQTKEIAFDNTASSQLIDVKAENTGDIQADVTYEGAATDWITTAVQADGVLVTVLANTGEARTARVTISAKGAKSLSIPVSQKGEETFTGTLTSQTEALSFRCSTSSKLIDVVAENTGDIKADVTYEGAATDWITTAVQADGVLVTVLANTGEARTARVIISAEGAESLSIPVSQKEVFASEIIGKYAPKLDEANSTEEAPYGDFYITYEWINPAHAPTIDLSFMDPTATEPMPISLDFLLPVAQQLIQQLYYRGLTFFDFKDDGTIGAGYCEVIDFLNLQFSEEKIFPNPATLALVPADAITYFTQEGKLYFAIDKLYLSQIGQTQLEMDLLPIIDDILAQYPDLGIISNEEVYALPLKYTLEGDVLTILFDREMMMPYKELIMGLMSMIPEELPLQMDPAADPVMVPARELAGVLIDAVFNQTKVFEIGIRLEKKAQ